MSVRLSDLDIDRRLARVVGKGSKERREVFDDDCKQDLLNWLEDRKK